MTPKFNKTCPVCNKAFETTTYKQKYCSHACYLQEKRNNYIFSLSASVPSGTVGAMHELFVCIHFMAKGYHVFRSQSPSCPCDLIIMRDDITYRVEVTTGSIKSSGGMIFPTKDFTRFDILAVVVDKNIIFYNQNHEEIKFDE